MKTLIIILVTLMASSLFSCGQKTNNKAFQGFNDGVSLNILLVISGIAFLCLTSCNSKLKILSDGWTRITTDEKKYSNRILFNPELLKIIDTNSIYKECCYIQNLDSSFFGLNKSKRYQSVNYPSQNSREYFRFYSDGYCNCFINDKIEGYYDVRDFNPDSTGFRGVYFQDKKNRIRIDLFTKTSGIGNFSNLKLYLKISGDTLFMTSKNGNNSYRVFIKKELSKDINFFKGWTK